MILNNGSAPIEPELRELRQDLPLSRHRRDDSVKSAETIRSDEHTGTVTDVTVTDLADVSLA
jgi:hypothetical protein